MNTLFRPSLCVLRRFLLCWKIGCVCAGWWPDRPRPSDHFCPLGCHHRALAPDRRVRSAPLCSHSLLLHLNIWSTCVSVCPSSIICISCVVVVVVVVVVWWIWLESWWKKWNRRCVGLGIYPAVDPLDSTSRMLDPRVIGEEHYATARSGSHHTPHVHIVDCFFFLSEPRRSFCKTTRACRTLLLS